MRPHGNLQEGHHHPHSLEKRPAPLPRHPRRPRHAPAIRRRRRLVYGVVGLHESIHVDWKRDGNMIIGKVVSDGKEFSTQGRSPEEFIEMVNDALYTVY